MKFLLKIIITSGLVVLISNLMSGVTLAHGFETSIIVALVLGLLNAFVKPILVLFTLPATIFTLGLFLLVINAVVILLCTKIVGGFDVDSFWTALLFSIFLSVSQSIMNGLMQEDK
ncbi:MAG: phage holin family protein [Bacteroidota bacterium]